MDNIVHAWDRKIVRGGVSYTVNREHPLVLALEAVIAEQQLPLFQKLLQTLELNFPFDAVYADMASERRPDTTEIPDKRDEDLYDIALRILDAIGKNTEGAHQFLRNLSIIEPFSKYPDETRKLTEKLEDVYRERTTN
jgi:hypothetical protein